MIGVMVALAFLGGGLIGMAFGITIGKEYRKNRRKGKGG